MRLKSLSFALVVGLLLSFPSLLLANSEYAPTASFYVSPSSGSINSTFTYNASASHDHRGFSSGLEYRWSFDLGTDAYSDWSTSSSSTHQYDSSGDKTVALEVRDQDGYTDTTYATVTIWDNVTFDGWFNVSPLEGDTSTVFTFEGEISTKGSVSKDEFQVRWDFDGDGDWDTAYSDSHVAYHSYPDTGYYNPKMEILSPDDDTLLVIGFEDDDPHEVTFLYVTFGQSPSASIDVYPTSGTTNTTFYFEGSDSFDSQDHSDIDIRWDLNGDGLFEYDWGDDESVHTKYEVPGTYQAIIQVRDSDGNEDEAYVTITVLDDNLAPEADFSVSSDSGLTDKSVGTTSTSFTFNASSSSDEEDLSSELQFRWDFDGDGSWDTTYDTEKRAVHRYLDAGTYTVILEVADTNGATDTATEIVTIVENDAPIPVFTVSPTIGTPGTTFSFDASDSSDSQYKSTSLEIRWDWEGDGAYDTTFEIDKTTSHQYEDPGDFTPTLQVRDPEGQTSTASQSISVVASTAPVARLTVDETSGTFSTAFHFDASESYDSETDQDDLWFRWDYDYTGENDIIFDTSWSRSDSKTKYFDQTGEVTVRVQVKDIDGEISTATLTVHLHWASAYMDHLKDNGIIQGYSGGDLAPDQQVTRAELLKMVMEAMDVNKYDHSYTGYFTDVARTDWHVAYVELAYEQGIASGYSDGLFRPNDPINRAEAMKIILNGFGVDLEGYSSGTFPDVGSSDWYSIYVGTAYEYGLVNGYEDGKFYPGNRLTRGEASKIIALAMEGLL